MLGRELIGQLHTLLIRGYKLNLRIRNTQRGSQNQGVLTIKITPKKREEHKSSDIKTHTLRTSKKVEKTLNTWKIRGEYDIPLSFRSTMLGMNDILRMNADITEIEKTRYTLHE